jgi:DDE superfamily endonuclease
VTLPSSMSTEGMGPLLAVEGRYLPGPGALQPKPLRENQRPEEVCVMLLAPVPWACRVWALPFLSAQAPYERSAAEQGKRHKPLTGWAWQLLLLVRRWQPEREVVAVADDGYASLKLLYRCRRLKNPITFITRLRLYAALYEPAPPRKPRQKGRPRLKASACPTSRSLSKIPPPYGCPWR